MHRRNLCKSPLPYQPGATSIIWVPFSDHQGVVLTKLAQSALLAAIFSLALASAAAQTLTGTVTNGTTNKPAVGDEVILINLSNGMDIAANTKVDSSGKFSFKLGEVGPHLIRAVHQGVTYHQMAPPGTNSVDVKVYDVATKVAELNVTADVLRIQADSGTLQGVRLFVVNNTSSPAKTQMNDHNFEFFLPPGAKIEQVQARAPNGQPIATEAAPQAEKNRYAIAFPLRPGETQFQLEFTLPYTGEIKIDPKPLYSAEHLVVVLPKTMQFTAANPASFQSVQNPGQGDTTVQVAQQTKAGQALAFTVKGNGTITESPGETASGAAQQQDQQGRRHSSRRRTRRPHRRSRCSTEISLAHPRRIRRAARDRRMDGHQTATRNIGRRNNRSEACFCLDGLQRSPPSNPTHRDGVRGAPDQRSSRKIIDAARSAKRRNVPTRDRTKTRQDHACGLREGQSSPRPNAGAGAEAAELTEHTREGTSRPGSCGADTCPRKARANARGPGRSVRATRGRGDPVRIHPSFSRQRKRRRAPGAQHPEPCI